MCVQKKTGTAYVVETGLLCADTAYIVESGLVCAEEIVQSIYGFTSN